MAELYSESAAATQTETEVEVERILLTLMVRSMEVRTRADLDALLHEHLAEARGRIWAALEVSRRQHGEGPGPPP